MTHPPEYPAAASPAAQFVLPPVEDVPVVDNVGASSALNCLRTAATDPEDRFARQAVAWLRLLVPADHPGFPQVATLEVLLTRHHPLLNTAGSSMLYNARELERAVDALEQALKHQPVPVYLPTTGAQWDAVRGALGLRWDFHEPDNQGVRAVVSGGAFDNTAAAQYGEQAVWLLREVEREAVGWLSNWPLADREDAVLRPVAVISLARLCGIAAFAGRLADSHPRKISSRPSKGDSDGGDDAPKQV